MTKTKAWIEAARLRTLPLSVSGIIVGSACALRGYTHPYAWQIFSLAILTTLLLQILSNFANDYGDGVKGTDNENRVGPRRAVQSGVITAREMKKGVVITSILSMLTACLLIYTAFGKENFGISVFYFILGLACVIAAIKYTVGQSAYGYRGLGDLFVFLFFGLVSVLGCYFLYTHRFDIWVVLPALAVGNLSIAVLNLNNMRDLESDKIAGKHTLAVKLGAKNAKIYHYCIILSALIAIFIYGIHVGLRWYSFFFLVTYIPFLLHMAVVCKNKAPKELDSEMKKVALSTFALAVMFSMALI